MPNYDYANSTGLTALSERTFEKIKKEITTDVVTSEAANPLVIETAAAQYAKNTHLTLAPVQDLHGYDRPWAGGAGKNKLDITISTRTNNGITFTNNGDGTITLNGTATAYTFINLNYAANTKSIPSGSYIFSGMITDIATRVYQDGTAILNYSGTTEQPFEISSEAVTTYARIDIATGTTFDKVVYRPMIRLASESDATFEPYSNICPISGLDEVKVARTGKNLLKITKPDETVYGIATVNNDGVLHISGTCTGSPYTIAIGEFKPYSTKVKLIYGANVTASSYTSRIRLDAYKGGSRVAYTSERWCGYSSEHLFDLAELFSGVDYDSVKLNMLISNAVTIDGTFSFMVLDENEESSVFEPYIKSEVSVDLPTTIYGGTLNLETGELVCDRAIVDMGDMTWSLDDTNKFKSQNMPAAKLQGRVVCSSYNGVQKGAANVANNEIAATGTQAYMFFRCKDERFSDASSFASAVNGVELVYELLNPITYHLTPSQLDLLKGTNVLTVNGKTIQVTYREGSLATFEEVNEVGDALVSKEYTSEEGNPITIETDAAQYAKKTHLTLEPVQDLHGYDHPWPAGGGKNKFICYDTTLTAAGLTFEMKGHSVKITGTVSADTAVNLNFGSGSVGAVLKNGSAYTWSAKTEGTISGNLGIYGGYLRSSVAQTSEFKSDGYASKTIPSEGTYRDRVWVAVHTGEVYNGTLYIQTEEGSEKTSFAPYSNICPITPMGHRNLLPMTVDGIKAANTTGVWSGNSITINGVTFTILTDSAGNITGIKANGTASGVALLQISPEMYFTEGQILSGITNSTGNGIGFGFSGAGMVVTNPDYTISALLASSKKYLYVRVDSGYTANNAIFYPMIRLASDPDSTFVPYGMARVGAKVTRKNKLPIEITEPTTAYGVTYTPQDDGTIKASGTATAWANCNITRYLLLKAGSYKVTGIPNIDGAYITVLNVVTGTSLGSVVYNEPELTLNFSEDTYVNIRLSAKSATVLNNDVYKPMIRYADIADSTFEPYTESVSSLDLPEPVYSGTLDLETGELVCDYVAHIFSDYGASNIGYSETGYFFMTPIDKGLGTTNLVTSIYKTVNKDSVTQMLNGEIKGGGINKNIYWKDSRYTSSASFLAENGSEQIIYELATPITYQLTPQQLALFKGTNNISTNAKTVQVTYRNGELATTGDIVASTEVAKQNAIGEAASYTDARLATELAPVTAELESLNARYKKRIVYPNINVDVLVDVGQIWLLVINWGSYSNMYNIENYANGIYIKNMIVNSNITSITVSAISGGYRITNNQESQCTVVAFRIA